MNLIANEFSGGRSEWSDSSFPSFLSQKNQTITITKQLLKTKGRDRALFHIRPAFAIFCDFEPMQRDAQLKPAETPGCPQPGPSWTQDRGNDLPHSVQTPQIADRHNPIPQGCDPWVMSRF